MTAVQSPTPPPGERSRARPHPVVEAVDVTRAYGRAEDPTKRRGRGRLPKQGTQDGNVVHALRGVTFAVQPGEFIAIAGPSGSGKSTLLHLLGALDRPTTGVIRFSGRDVATLDDGALARLRNREIGFVFQQFHLLGRTSALANVALPLLYGGVSKAERLARAEAALESVGLRHRLDHRPAQLSGGEQQRVAIARALVTQPRLLLADEPTGNLDTVTGAEIIALLQRVNEERGVAVIIITHEPHVAATAPRRIQIQDGVLIQARDL
jgi:putative ABC transport system ATP-binding protein